MCTSKNYRKHPLFTIWGGQLDKTHLTRPLEFKEDADSEARPAEAEAEVDATPTPNSEKLGKASRGLQLRKQMPIDLKPEEDGPGATPSKLQTAHPDTPDTVICTGSLACFAKSVPATASTAQ